jgi:O-methyltransferase involved in polyketide biosynthesis
MNNNQFNEAQFGAMRTAFLTAFPKIFTDIEYSQEIFYNMKDLAIDKGFSFTPNLFNNQMAIEIEARHKALNKALEKHITPDSLVIEIAAGMTPRHLEFRNYKYLEVDFTPVMNIKKDIYQKINKNNSFDNTIVGIDLTDTNKLRTFLTDVSKTKQYDKIIILNEGLFWYLNKEEIAAMTTAIYESLIDTNWLWITSDCPTEDKIVDDYRKVISDSAKVKRGTFSDYNDFTDFFRTLGLKNQRHKLSVFLTYEDLTSAKLFSVEKSEVIRRINSYTDIAVFTRV